MRHVSRVLGLALGLLAGASESGRSRPPLLAKLGEQLAPAVSDYGAAEHCSVRPLKLPTGLPAMLTCRDARRIITEARARLATPAVRPDARGFATATAGWLDPHGLWAAAPDAPMRGVLAKHARELIEELEASPRDSSECAASLRAARPLQKWVDTLRVVYDAAPEHPGGAAAAFELASASVFQDDPVTRPGRALARDVGGRAKAFARHFPGASAARAALDERLLPRLALSDWQQVVLAAAVRAYVPAVDAHGQWAPLDEEWSLYAADAALDVGPRLWGRMMRTALGIRVLDDASPPLAVNDLVLSVGGIATAGLSVEQGEQLSRLEAVGGEAVRDVVVLRAGESESITLGVPIDEAAPTESKSAPFEIETVKYAAGAVVVVGLRDVPHDAGEELAAWIAERRSAGQQPSALLLDLRGNGGGSIDGAAGVIGVFLPGVPIFPLRRRGGGIEIQHAARPPEGTWSGPVATLVDGYTASAAEMIAGGLSAYRRGSVIGARTFGKGCVQEYFDDLSGVGVLRLTTMVFSLPDGSPLQGHGLTPTLPLQVGSPRERELNLPGALAAWAGPDVRRPTSIGGPPWPPHAGALGTCSDATLCAALRRLGAEPARSPRAAVRPGAAPRRAAPSVAVGRGVD